jgi:hypothetical protein
VSIAWSTIAFLVLLLPGFLFLLGIYLPENFTRETAPRSALGQLAATVLISLVVHGTVYSIAQSLHFNWLPHIDLEQVLHLLQVEPLPHNEFKSISLGIERYRWWILGYTLATSLIGLFLGRELGCLIVSGRLRGLAEHAWVYDLRIEGIKDRPAGLVVMALALAAKLWSTAMLGLRVFKAWLATSLPAKMRVMGGKLLRGMQRPRLQTVTVAYALTDTVHGERYLLYRGLLKAFGISKDGRPQYLVLSNVLRSYMLLSESTSSTSEEWHAIGSGDNSRTKLPGARLSSYLVLSGDHVLNVVFDRHAFTQTRAGIRALDAALAKG